MQCDDDRLPGFAARGLCWKCGGSGRAPLGRRARLRLCRPDDDDDEPRVDVLPPCGVCRGIGRVAAKPASTRPGRVSDGPRPGDANFVGPEPVGGDSPHVGEDLSMLCGKWRIFQRHRGHRYSTEDVVTAWEACRVVLHLSTRTGRRIAHVDLGSGIGSVLLMTAWRLAESSRYSGLGVEAQKDSWRLATRSIAYNGASCRSVLGDIRDHDSLAELLRETIVADDDESCTLLVTGTPPYYGVVREDSTRGGGTEATTRYGALPRCEQSAGARYEFRGGIEIYCAAAARLLRAWPRQARFVCCEGGLDVNARRVDAAASAAGLRVLERRMVSGKIGKPALFGVWTMALDDDDDTVPSVVEEHPLLTVRAADDAHTPEYRRLLHEMAMLRR
mmetsp:Transcript_26276/g.105159  ORF Transcript_26276/g.105159 Transcript_26276/m.105159 type:complete len:389 (-) Transcript_26276:1449-2615(-)